VLLEKVKDFDIDSARERMREVRKLFVYDMGPNWYQGAFGMIVRQLELKSKK
jgi:hypothetical protein